MSGFVKVDRKKCDADGSCCKVCPLGLLRMDPKEKIPAAVEGAREMCISCGHCVSVCPKGALSLESVALEECAELPADWRLDPRRVETLLKGRRSIRAFKPQPVPRDDLEKLIDIARYAPSGVNRQPLKWTVIYERDKVQAYAGAVAEWMEGMVSQGNPTAKALRLQDLVEARTHGKDLICRNAPHLVLTWALKDDIMAAQASTTALTFLDIAAVSMGLGACWAGYCQWALNSSEKCRHLAGINKRCACFGAMLVGHPAVRYSRIPPRNKARISWK
jgi:ferredoxin